MLIDIANRSYLRKYSGKTKQLLMPVGPTSASAPLMEYIKYYFFTAFTPKFPQIIQIQTQYGCNARCIFCPMGRERNPLSGRMDDETFSRIVEEAVKNGVKVLSPYLQNEPLVDRQLHERIRIIREIRGRLPLPKTKIITNGGLLTEERATDLIESGLEYIVFSVHGVERDVYDKTMRGPRFETVIENIDRFLRIKEKLRTKRPAVEIWAVMTADMESQLAKARAFWAKKGIRFKTRALDNRANPEIVDTKSIAGEQELWAKTHYCAIPFWRAWILCNGDLVLCCVDWERTTVFGNIHQQSIKEIWNGSVYEAYRNRMRQRDLACTLCENCQGT
jgi:MoaA/NifB/PqqE/SkfB family radical SAM enzyme